MSVSGHALRLTKHASEHFYIIRLLKADWLLESRKHKGSEWNRRKESKKKHCWSNFSTAEEECRLSLRRPHKIEEIIQTCSKNVEKRTKGRKIERKKKE